MKPRLTCNHSRLLVQQLGGTPEFLQGEEIPHCSCGKQMTFHGQLDSINDDWCLADCGKIYVFVCFETKNLLQSD
jgi:hypothetical protein